MPIKISALPSGSAPTGVELVPAVQSGVTVSLTQAQLLAPFTRSGGNLTLPAPGSGIAAAISGAANSPTVTLTGSATSGQSFGLDISAGTTSADYGFLLTNHAQTVNFCEIFGDGHGNLGPVFGGLSWSAAGNVTTNAPSSGVAQTINTFAGQFGLVVQGDGSTNFLMSLNSSAATTFRCGLSFVQTGGTPKSWAIGNDVDGGSSNNFEIRDLTRNAVPLAISTTGGVSTTAPTSGTGLTIGGVGGSAATVTAFGPVAAAQVDMTPDTGTFTITYTGLTTVVTGTATWSRIGKLVCLYFPAGTGVSNSTALTATGLPAAIQPATLTQLLATPQAAVEDGGGFNALKDVQITAGSGTATFFNGGSSTGFTNTATAKGVAVGFTVSYLLN